MRFATVLRLKVFFNLSGTWVQVVALLSLIFLLAPVGRAFGQTSFYQGKTITLVRGSTPGGIGEMRVKALMSYLKKHIPGQPTVLIEFMDGGGGRKAANHVFGMSDGLTVGSTPGGILASALQNPPAFLCPAARKAIIER